MREYNINLATCDSIEALPQLRARLMKRPWWTDIGYEKSTDNGYDQTLGRPILVMVEFTLTDIGHSHL